MRQSQGFMIALIALGIIPFVGLPKILLVAMFVLTLNHLRTLTAHRYNNEGSSNWRPDLARPDLARLAF
jgi:hypothetical protein